MRRILMLALLLGLAPGCAGSRSIPIAFAPSSSEERLAFEEEGYASYYGREHHGRRTASGERFDAGRLTAAHRTLPFGTRVRVTNLDNGRKVVVTVTDRGPFRRHRVIDVSRRAAEDLGFLREGTARVRLEVLSG
ncbi:MAG TPA: septal ring lytic transglycosylase RlpA family protein [Candidatus Eisenbacteria bacterium]|nr:septal ring lytic transglycosylase RlpA family protein [Candidatus Eisenbacteria bacterium]